MTSINTEEAFVASFFLSYSLGLLAIVLTSVYVLNIIKWIAYWRNEGEYTADSKESEPLSVVIALHNESDNIRTLLESLKGQTVTPDEVILICDHCTDNTEAIIKEYIEINPQFKATIATNTGKAGKKNAQRMGVKLARNEYVAVMDGDCVAKPKWYETLAGAMSEKHPELMILPVAMRANGKSTVQQLMELEFVSLQLATAATAIYRRPTMCNGANMAFRRETYLSHKGKEDYASGDDMFLLSEIKEKGGEIAYLKSAEAVIETPCPKDIPAYYRQRTRWLRKSTGYTDKDVKKLAIIIAIGNATWPIAGILMMPCMPWTTLACFIIKTSSEMALLWQGRDIWQHKWNAANIVVLAIIYPFVLLSITVTAIFRSRKEW